LLDKVVIVDPGTLRHLTVDTPVSSDEGQQVGSRGDAADAAVAAVLDASGVAR
jgi:hypothetical protein